ncbi:HRDC domain-containing protein, partial [Parabacteroides distasonis]
YYVIPNKTIADIARKRPTTFDELALIPGLGETRRAKYGEALLAIVARYTGAADSPLRGSSCEV